MTNGQSALSITDLPFWYSFLNLLYILQTGTIDTDRFIIVGLIAGFVGTFFVFWHPFQWIIGKIIWCNRNRLTAYHIEAQSHNPPFYDVNIDDNFFSLSLHSSSIGLYKTKLVSQFYFVSILITFLSALTAENFQKLVTEAIKDLEFINISIIIIVVLIMIGIMGGLIIFRSKEIIKNVALHALYYFISERLKGYANTTHVKQALDLNDWGTVKQSIDRDLTQSWTSLKQFSK